MKLRFPHILLQLLLLSVALLSAGCSDSENTRQLDRAEAIIEERPDSALSILQSIPSKKNSREQARYALLMTQAQVKLDLPVSSDSLISEASAFFTLHHPESTDCMKALFYHSEVLRLSGAVSRSLSFAVPAYDLAHKQHDNYWMAKSAEQMAIRYDALGNDSLSYLYSREAAARYLSTDRELNHLYSLADAVRSLVAMRRYPDAINLGDSLLQVTATWESPEAKFLKGYIHRSLLPAYVYSERYAEGLESLNQISSLGTVEAPKAMQYMHAAQLMFGLGRYREAADYISYGRSLLATPDDSMMLYHTLSLYHRSQGDAAAALTALDSLADMQTGRISAILHSSTSVEENRYYHDRAILKEAETRLWRTRLYAFGILIVIVIASGVLLHLQSRRRMEERMAQDRLSLQMATDEILHLSEIGKVMQDEIDTRLHEEEKMKERMLALTDERDGLEKILRERNDKNDTAVRDGLRSLFDRQCATINRICAQYNEDASKSASAKIRDNNVVAVVKEMITPKTLSDIEGMVDSVTGGMVTRLRRQYTDLSEQDLQVILLSQAGFRPAAIAIILSTSVQALYKRRRRLIKKLEESGAPDKDQFLTLIAGKL